METMKMLGENSTAKMKAQVLELGRTNFTGKIVKSSGNIIPAVSKVDINIDVDNELLRKVGVYKRLKPTKNFSRSEANKMNRYIGHQILRMRKCEGTEKYFTIMNFCLIKSVSFRVSAINHVIPTGGYALRTTYLKGLNKRVSSILKYRRSDLISSRVYIEKANGKGRPLGVPTIEGRIALHMLNNMLVEMFRNDMLDSQHGYLPGRGTLSAGRSVIANIINKKNIYETDIKGFFDNIKLKHIAKELFEKLPEDINEGIYRLNERAPLMPEVEKLEETRRPFIFSRLDVTSIESSPLNDGASRVITLMGEKRRVILASDKGVPQGAPTSPFLAILGLRDYLKQGNLEVVNYADDQIFASDKDFEVKDMPEIGIEHAKEKCSGVKKDGVGQKELKFLGLVYNPGEGTLRSETRSEKSIRINEDLIKLYDEIKYKGSRSGLEDLSRRNLFGFVQASLYMGSFAGQNSYKEHQPKAVKGSGLGEYKNSKTISSLAMLHLADTIKRTMRNH